MAYTTEQLRAMDKQHVWHPFTPMPLWLESDPLVIVAAEGMELIDSDGRRYLDAVSSLWCNVHGHRVPEIDAAVRAQLDRVAHSTMLGLTNEPAVVLADKLMRLVPPGLTKIFYSDAGATANEIAFKLAVQYWFNIGQPQKKEFIGFSEAYHGDTFGAMSVGRTELFHRAYLPMLFKTHFVPTPFTYRFDEIAPLMPMPATGADVAEHCLQRLEAILRERGDRIAAVCIEPKVQGAAGMIVQPDGFLRGVRHLCSEHNVLLIADEVAVGFGRTGRLFACEHEGVSPDLMCVAKGITGGYLPLAATFATQTIFDAFLGEPAAGKTFYHGHTYTGNPLACAAAIASLDLFDTTQLLPRVNENAAWLADRLRSIAALPCVGDIRQCGLMVGIELVADRRTRQRFNSSLRVGAALCFALRKHGVLLRPLGDVIVLMPPLAMSKSDLGRIVDALQVELRQLHVGV